MLLKFAVDKPCKLCFNFHIANGTRDNLVHSLTTENSAATSRLILIAKRKKITILNLPSDTVFDCVLGERR